MKPHNHFPPDSIPPRYLLLPLPPPPLQPTKKKKMRAGGCTVQQALAPEAASVVKQAVGLARRRGHAQVTPLHVATTMLSTPAGLLRAACLRSRSHPLQCKALELCFNVALNRLPSSTLTHHHHHHHPSLSNALVAAFKRAQAHQRRGSVETQHPPLLAVKIELEQLVVSILDDPSVSRVMREAGFSSTQVKTHVEQAVSSEACTPTPPNPSSTKPNEGITLLTPPQESKPRPMDQDVATVVDCLVSRRRRSVVVVGECSATAEAVVRGVMDRVDKGEVPEALRSLQFVTLQLSNFRLMSREEVDQKVGELRRQVRSSCAGRGAVLYLGDLEWAAEYRVSCEERGRSRYCPVEHAIMEIRCLVNGGMLWLMGIATHQTYMRCRIGNPSLEDIWGLQPLAVPAATLELSLNSESDLRSRFESRRSGDALGWALLQDGVGSSQLNCCADCSVKFETEARALPNISSSSHVSITLSLPSWLQPYNEESKRASTNDRDSIQNLCKKWNSICNSSHKNQHHPTETSLHFSSASPSSSISSYNQHNSRLHCTRKHWAQQLGREHQFGASEAIEGFDHGSRFYIQDHKGLTLPPLCFTNPKSNPSSTSSSCTMEMEHLNKFKELNAGNLKTLCNALERKVPWQSGIIPEIASTALKVRSGMVRRKEGSGLACTKEDTWLFFLGADVGGKEKIGKELASLVFGSHANFISIGLSNFSSTEYSALCDDPRNKRSRLEGSHSCIERFGEAISHNPHRVILVEDIDRVDSYSQTGIKTAIKRGRTWSSNGEEHSVCDAIVILCCESFESRSRSSSPVDNQKSGSEEAKDGSGEAEISSCAGLDLNLSAVDEDTDQGCYFEHGVGLLELVDRVLFLNLPED